MENHNIKALAFAGRWIAVCRAVVERAGGSMSLDDLMAQLRDVIPLHIAQRVAQRPDVVTSKNAAAWLSVKHNERSGYIKIENGIVSHVTRHVPRTAFETMKAEGYATKTLTHSERTELSERLGIKTQSVSAYLSRLSKLKNATKEIRNPA